MKAIKYNDQIITLDNVQKVELFDSGTGAKSNPHRYSLHIITTTNNEVHLTIGDVPEEVAKNVLNEIFDIITK